jgi:hypothetical protein
MASSGSGGGSLGSPCGACKFLRRKCAAECVFAPHFCAEDGAAQFAAIHKVFGASNAAKLLQQVAPADRSEAAATVTYEAQARLRDPIYGCVAHIFALQQQVRACVLLPCAWSPGLPPRPTHARTHALLSCVCMRLSPVLASFCLSGRVTPLTNACPCISVQVASLQMQVLQAKAQVAQTMAAAAGPQGTTGSSPLLQRWPLEPESLSTQSSGCYSDMY